MTTIELRDLLPFKYNKSIIKVQKSELFSILELEFQETVTSLALQSLPLVINDMFEIFYIKLYKDTNIYFVKVWKQSINMHKMEVVPSRWHCGLHENTEGKSWWC